MASSSETLRNDGNKYFSEYKKCVSEDGRKLNLHKATACYSDALKAAQSESSPDDIKSAAKNLFVCYYYLYNIESKLSTKEFCLNEGMKFASLAIHHHRLCTSSSSDDNWLKQMFEKLKDHLSNVWQHADKLPMINEKIKFIYVLGNQLNKDSSEIESEIIAQFRMEQTNMTVTHGMQYILDKDFKKGLNLIHEAYFPLQETLRIRKGISNGDLQILQQEYQSFKSLGEALQCYHVAMDFLNKALNSEEQLQIEIVWDALDNFQQSTLLSKGESVEFICMAQARIGIIYYKILKNERRARSYFQECVSLAHTLQKNNYEDEWYVLATTNLKEIQEIFQKLEEKEWQNQRKEYLDKLKDEMSDLDSKSSSDDKEFMEYVSKKFPSKHKSKFEEIIKKILKETNIKKALQKFITLYHPDKVSSDEHTMEYYVLCEEISKRLTARYEKLKR